MLRIDRLYSCLLGVKLPIDRYQIMTGSDPIPPLPIPTPKHRQLTAEIGFCSISSIKDVYLDRMKSSK